MSLDVSSLHHSIVAVLCGIVQCMLKVP